MSGLRHFNVITGVSGWALRKFYGRQKNNKQYYARKWKQYLKAITGSHDTQINKKTTYTSLVIIRII